MFSLQRPRAELIEQYRAGRLEVAPSYPSTAGGSAGYRRQSFDRLIGVGSDAFARASEGLRSWAAHRGAAVEVFPDYVGLAEGEVVAILTRQLGLWVLACCRIERVIDEPTSFGFVYATVPGHPVEGHESFIVRLVDGEVRFEIVAVSRPAVFLTRLGRPVTPLVQARTSERYLDALARWTDRSA